MVTGRDIRFPLPYIRLVIGHTNNFLASFGTVFNANYYMRLAETCIQYLVFKICNTSRIMQPFAFFYMHLSINHRLATFANGVEFS